MQLAHLGTTTTLRRADGMVDDQLAIAITEYLVASYGMRRPPTLNARLLALIAALADKGLPFLTRADAAEMTGFTVEGVDSALSVALARGDITMSVKMRPGNVQQRESVIRERYYAVSPPIKALQRVVQSLRRTG